MLTESEQLGGKGEIEDLFHIFVVGAEFYGYVPALKTFAHVKHMHTQNKQTKQKVTSKFTVYVLLW